MLTIINDPAGITGRRRVVLDTERTLQAQIMAAMPEGAGDCILRINGHEVDPLTDPRLDRPPRADDEIAVIKRPGTGYEWIYYLAVAIFTVYTIANLPKITTDGIAKQSPNNSLTAQTNIARAYQAVPDVYGYRRVWPDLIQNSVVEYILNVKYVTEWLCVSRGRGTITEVRYAETPIEDIDGASFQVFEPAASPSPYAELNDTTLTNVLESFTVDDVNGQELNYDDGATFIRRNGQLNYTAGDAFFTVTVNDSDALDYMKSQPPSGTCGVEMLALVDDPGFSATCTVLEATVSGIRVIFKFSNAPGFTTDYAPDNYQFIFRPVGAPPTNIVGPFTLPIASDRIRVNLFFPNGLNATVGLDAEWWQIDADGVEVSGTRQTGSYSYSAASYDQQFFTTDIVPSAGLGRYRIQFDRTTANAGDGSDTMKLEAMYALRSYATKVLPGVTVVRVTTKATQQATAFQDRKFNLRFARHVRPLDADTPQVPSRNFGRAMVHLWAVAGENMAELDTDRLDAINKVLGEDSALLRFDGSLDDADASLGERLQLIANHARCDVWRDGTAWTVTRDELRTAPELQLDYRNLAAGGESTITYAAHLPASYDGVEVEYVNQATQATKAYARLKIVDGAVVSGTPRNAQKIKLPGCVTDAQALNRAHLEVRRILYSRVSVQDTALADASALGKGSLVRWVDPNDFVGSDGLQAGEVIELDGTAVYTSEPLDWKGEASGRMLLTGADGRYLSAPIVCTPITGGALLDSLPSGVYLRDGTRQLGSRYTFAVGLTEAELQASGLYLTTEVAPTSDRTVNLTLAAYDARMYAMD
jgi:hypothetical protein